MRNIQRQSIAVLAALLIVAQAASAYDYPLHSEDMRDAYFLGERNNQETVECLLKYVHRITRSQNGSYSIQDVEIRTPYLQIVLRGREDKPGDSAVQAETDVEAHPLNFLVRVRLQWNDSYVGDAAPVALAGDDLSIRVAQKKEITPLHVRHIPISGRKGPIQEIIEMEFDPAKISSAPLHVSVQAADGQTEETEFDLAKIH